MDNHMNRAEFCDDNTLNTLLFSGRSDPQRRNAAGGRDGGPLTRHLFQTNQWSTLTDE
jgi:hypothetical protein